MKAIEISHQTLLSLGLTIDEYHRIINYLGRKPNLTELHVFSVMWSEHCSYKSSRYHLKKFPTTGPRVVQGPGENAGVVDIGDNQVAIFKMESHNHPSFIEPYQGAATGVGGILRDIFTMGGEPMALLNSLRFGLPSHPKTKYLVEGVVSGISGYGNCFGCPTVGGEVYFHESYNLNPLVNAFCLGIAEKNKVFYGHAKGEGNPVIYVGSKTGRDGIHGATMASQEFDDEIQSKKPTVQVGDPFTEKLLLEACLELMKKEYLVGIQDMGAAGLTSSSVEMASRAGCGIVINLSKVPVRETKMRADELLLSESQERMLLVVKKGFEQKVREIFEKWDLNMAVVGCVTSDSRFRAILEGEEVVNIPVRALTEGAPVYDRPVQEPPKLKKSSHIKEGRIFKTPPHWGEVLKKLIGSPNLSSRKWIYRQYDHQVKTNSVIFPGGEAAVIRLKGFHKALAMSVDGNSRYCYIDPFQGGMLAVVEGARNVSCVGAEPIGLTDCLNFGNPQNPEIMWQFKRVVEGMSEACRFFKIPVVSGNVSFYNETKGKSIYPTPTIGMVGLIPNLDYIMTHSFKEPKDLIVLIGENFDFPHDESLAGSEVLSCMGEGTYETGGLPALDLALEQKVQKTVRELILKKVIRSAHDCSEGGLSIAVLESCFENNIGVTINYRKEIGIESLLFGESPSRVIVSLSKNHLGMLSSICQREQVPYEVIGETMKDRYVFNDIIDEDLGELKKIWENAFEQILHH